MVVKMRAAFPATFSRQVVTDSIPALPRRMLSTICGSRLPSAMTATTTKEVVRIRQASSTMQVRGRIPSSALASNEMMNHFVKHSVFLAMHCTAYIMHEAGDHPAN
jgi:hypothetical protein